ncbi:MAG: peptide chain release factor N(5)-glutamine methyltransferase [Mangrovicoccus sp.]|nr:peptide chain release factor N(5)-glutamine methyltransferase [Mangrovicoccus sp.]
MSPPLTIAQAMYQGSAALREAGVPEAAGDARALMAHALGVGRDRLTLLAPDPIPHEALPRWRDALARRARREPVSHIIGSRAFYGRDFKVTSDVLDPRPETEILVGEALGQPYTRLLDLGTGSGAIVLSLLAERPRVTAMATDISAAALSVAQENAASFGVTDRVEFRHCDWWDGVDGQFDLIVSNPPYIAEDELPDLAAELQHYEPMGALSPGGDGLEAYRQIIAGLRGHLRPDGRALFEIGAAQGPAVCALAEQAGFSQILCLPDLDGRDRVVSLRA